MTDRTIEHEIDVPGTPEEVWDSIATGHGITTWFVPTEVEERVGGTVALDFGPGMGVQKGTITAWEPARRFVYEAMGMAGHPLASEWLIEPKAGGQGCTVRMVVSGFLDEAEWKAEYDATFEGWRLFLHNLQLARTHFPGQRCSAMLVNGTSDQPLDAAWQTLTRELGLSETPSVGQSVTVRITDGPSLSGTVERFEKRLLTLLLESPARGVGFVGLEGSGPTLYVSVYTYLYGADAAAIVARDEPAWRAWMARTFAASGAPA